MFSDLLQEHAEPVHDIRWIAALEEDLLDLAILALQAFGLLYFWLWSEYSPL